MASTIDHGDLLHDPEAMLAQREAIALRSMLALIGIVEGGKDERAKVAAATELNKMLSLGLVNRPSNVKATQINNLRLPPGQATDEATTRLLAKFGGTGDLPRASEVITTHDDDTLAALSEFDDD
jgi:hypothetical protein